jgi:hypothetical protein
MHSRLGYLEEERQSDATEIGEKTTRANGWMHEGSDGD